MADHHNYLDCNLEKVYLMRRGRYEDRESIISGARKGERMKIAGSSHLQETELNMVSQTIFSKTFFVETQAGTTTYPLCTKVPACIVSVALTVERRICNAKAQGSIPCGYIPALSNHSPVPDLGAGNSFNTTTTPMSCAHYIYQIIGYGRTINAVSTLPLHHTRKSDHTSEQTEGTKE